MPVPGWDTVPRAVAELPWRTPAWWQRATARRWPGLLVASVLSATVAVLATLAVVNVANPTITHDHFTLTNNSGSTQYLHHCKGSCETLDASTDWVRSSPGALWTSWPVPGGVHWTCGRSPSPRGQRRSAVRRPRAVHGDPDRNCGRSVAPMACRDGSLDG